MSLTTIAQTRIPAAELVQLTNPGDRSATTVDSTVLAAAVADAEAEFQLETGLEFDSAVAAHAAIGWVGVRYYLESYAGGAAAQGVDQTRQRWERGLAKIARMLGGDLPLLPQTLSPLQSPTTTTERAPDNDRAAWGDVILDRGPGRAEDDLRRG